MLSLEDFGRLCLQIHGLSPNTNHFKQLSLSSGFLLSEFRPRASARRFTKSHSECHLACAELSKMR